MRRLIGLLLAARAARAAPVPRAAAVALLSLAFARHARAAVGLDTSEVKPFADAGDYAAEVCTRNPRTKELNRLCEAFALHWDLMVHDLEDVCEDETGGPCPKDINDTLPFYGTFRKHSLRLEAGLYAEESKMAELLNDRRNMRRLRRLSAVHSATSKYEEEADGKRLAELLEEMTNQERRAYMVHPKAPRTTELFQRAEAQGVSLMELLRQDIAQGGGQAPRAPRKKKRRRRKTTTEDL